MISRQRPSRRSIFLSGLAGCALAAAAGSACAQQCTWYILDVPDFDQRRTASGGIAGLPANGKMYCVPTAFTNWFAYVANRGIPQPATLAGPRDWESNANYDRVTTVLSLMGGFMNTDPEEGTRGGSVPGAKFYVSLMANGDLTISGNSVWGGGKPPTPEGLQLLHQLGAYTSGTYGRYSSSTGGTRGGGHAITFVGVWDLGCGSAPILQFRDPADTPTDTTQSAFRTSLALLTPVTGIFRPSSGGVPLPLTMYRLDVESAGVEFLDKVYCILPTAALFAGGGLDAGELRLVRPFRPQGNLSPASVLFNKPAGSGPVVDVAISPDPLVHYYITGQGTTMSDAVWRLNVLTGQSTRMDTASTLGYAHVRLAVNRFGELYVIDGVSASVRRYDTTTTPMSLLGSYAPPSAPEAIAYDDKNDTLVILTAPPLIGLPRRVITTPRSLSGFGTNRALPATYSGKVYIQPDADAAGAYFVCSEGSGILRRVAPEGGELVVTDSIIHLNGSLSALNVTDANRLVYAVNGVLVERERNASGTWVNKANSRWAGRAAGGSVSMARSRTNFLASVMDNPAFNNLDNPRIFPSLPVCYANCDGSTVLPVLNVDDFVCFQQRFAAGHVYANCDNSTTPPILNVDDFVCYQQRFAVGCQ